jgi:hypothetical protein
MLIQYDRYVQMINLFVLLGWRRGVDPHKAIDKWRKVKTLLWYGTTIPYIQGPCCNRAAVVPSCAAVERTAGRICVMYLVARELEFTYVNQFYY